MPNIDEAIEALLSYQQADMEGVMVLTSRQAIHEVADELKRVRSHAQGASASIEVDAEKIIENHIRMLDIGLGDEFRIPDAIASVRKEKSLAAANDLIGCIASWAAADIAKLLTDSRTPAESEKAQLLARIAELEADNKTMREALYGPDL